MFKEITIKPSNDLPADLGQITECMLFYEKVNLVCGVPFFSKLIDTNQVYSFLELTKLGSLTVHLEDNFYGIMNHEVNGETSKWARIILASGQNVSLQDRLEREILKRTQRRGYTRRLTNKILNNSNVLLHGVEVAQYIHSDLDDEIFLKRVISQSANHYNPDILIPPETIQTNLQKINEGFILRTNLDLDKINNSNPENIFDENTIIGNIKNSRVDSTLAARFNSDIVTSAVITAIIKEKVNSLISKSSRNLEEIDSFSNMVLSEGRSVALAINSGNKSITDFIKIMEKAEKFKQWLADVEADKSLIQEYHKAVTKETWIDKLPGKTFRWAFFTGAGLLIDAMGAGGLGTSSGLALSAGDTFLLDKINKGWQPNSFINKELENFVK